MASDEVDYAFVEALPADLTCPICKNVFFEPHMVNCCNQEYCLGCLKQWQKRNSTCPKCCSNDFSHMLMKQTSRKVEELKVYCPNKKHGCQSVLKISEYKNHLMNSLGCDYVKIQCTYLCQTAVFRCHYYEHQANDCVRRPVSCTYCNLLGEYQDIVGDHINSCPSFPRPCPQNCGATVLRKELESHQEECPMETVPCPFNELGCKVKVHRKDLEKHVESSAFQHMTDLAKSHISLKAENRELKSRLNAVGAQIQSLLPSIRAVSHNVHDEVAKMYPLLVDTSTITVGSTVTLGLLGANEEAGHHYFELCKLFKFKIEWKLIDKEKFRQIEPVDSFQTLLQNVDYNQFDSERQRIKKKQLKKAMTPKKSSLRVQPDSTSGIVYHLKLYSVVDEDHTPLPNSWNCDVLIRVTPGQSYKQLAVIRGGIVEGTIGIPGIATAANSSCEESLKLLGSVYYPSQNFSGSRCLEIGFKGIRIQAAT